MNYKKILTIQDISCIGQCSTTVALPILSAAGHETCIMPSAMLSTHTVGFKDFTFLDLSEEMNNIADHWEREGIKFDVIYTGYLDSIKAIDCVLRVCDRLLKSEGIIIVDPAMADNGVLYPGFDDTYVDAMKKLCKRADIIMPNITEAAMISDYEYSPSGEYSFEDTYKEEDIKALLGHLREYGYKDIVLTGIGYKPEETGIAILQEDYQHTSHEKFRRMFHGTGDVFASSLVGFYLNGNSLIEAARLAGEFTLEAIRATLDDEEHWYGVKFETVLHKLIK